MAEITMPKMSDTMEEGRVIRWLKHPGDSVSEGEPIAEIETDKANVEMEAFEPGVLTNIIVPEGETVTVGTPIAELQPSGTASAATPQAQPQISPAPTHPEIPVAAPEPRATDQVPLVTAPPPPEATAPAPKAEAKPTPETPAGERIPASPLARRMAEEHGIDLSKVQGTGPDGRIVESDIQNYLSQTQRPAAPVPVPAAPPKPAPLYTMPSVCPIPEEEPLSRMRRVIAERMSKSKQTIPHFYITSEVGMDWASRVRDELNEDETQPKVSFNDLIVKACALALEKFPRANAFFGGDKLILHENINIGIAVALDDGLIVPVVHDADKKSLREIAELTRELARRARENELHQSDYTGATFTVTNLGMFDVENFMAIIDPPESGTLAIGTIREMPAVIDGKIAVSKRMKMTLSGDHRVLDGAVGAKFLQEIKRRLESPIGLL